MRRHRLRAWAQPPPPLVSPSTVPSRLLFYLCISKQRAVANRDGDTRAEILRTAGRLLQTRGYNGFSYAHVAEALGVKPAAIHYHFKSKEDLGVAVAQRFRDRWRAFRAEYDGAGPLARLEALFDLYGRMADLGRGCPAAAIHAEYDAVPEAVGEAARAVVEEFVEWLERALEDGRSQGKLRFAGDARELALVLISQAQGALLVARSMGPEVFHAIRAQALSTLFGAPPSVRAAPAKSAP